MGWMSDRRRGWFSLSIYISLSWRLKSCCFSFLDDTLIYCGNKTVSALQGRGRGQSRGRGRSFLSTKVQRSLNPALYRNVEYDVWLRSKRRTSSTFLLLFGNFVHILFEKCFNNCVYLVQQQRDFCIAVGMQYSVGDKCKVSSMCWHFYIFKHLKTLLKSCF